MINLRKINCCGCSACVSICPQHCLEMRENREGFYEPILFDADKCIQCNKCITVCPVINVAPEKQGYEKAYIVQNTDETVRAESTSGGAFSAIAMSVIDLGGIVYGAAYDDQLMVSHMGRDHKDELWRFRNSKYVQSEMRNVFAEVKQYLECERYVCFSGTPCQIEGLINFLQKPYDNLITVDVVCRAVSTPLLWKKYLNYQKRFYSPSHIAFRHKHYGYKYSTMSIFDSKKKEVYYEGVESDLMLRAFFSDICDRKSCYECKFKKRYRVSDFTIWDCFQPGYFDKKFDDDKGTSNLIIHSDKGERLFEKITSKGYLRYKEVSPDQSVQGMREMFYPVPYNHNRKAFFEDLAVMDEEIFFDKYFSKTYKVRLTKWARVMAIKLHVYKKMKWLLFLYRRKKQSVTK
ncbi:MAG: Coenzyme F420 hydrogenase/dehydrogenase, beta subunit C-terminal domain [Lachnospiraceae bacterium]|nr:Coenzyme F420 hydrogenase/dehydrogenase, beta subunit C-terminal domain [Lachnospiraceae bacterium]